MRVLLCRARPDGEATAARLRAAGHEAVVAPVLEIVGVPTAPPDHAIDALLATSPNAMMDIDTATAERWAAVPLYAVGSSTAAAARAAGLREVRIGAGDGASLLDLLRLTLRAPARVLYLAGAVHKPALPAALEAAGYQVTILTRYDARPVGWDTGVAAALRTRQIAAAFHFSRRSADLALAAAAAVGVVAEFAALRHICISTDAAEPLHGVVPVPPEIAERPDEDSLLKALASILHG